MSSLLSSLRSLECVARTWVTVTGPRTATRSKAILKSGGRVWAGVGVSGSGVGAGSSGRVVDVGEGWSGSEGGGWEWSLRLLGALSGSSVDRWNLMQLRSLPTSGRSRIARTVLVISVRSSRDRWHIGQTSTSDPGAPDVLGRDWGMVRRVGSWSRRTEGEVAQGGPPWAKGTGGRGGNCGGGGASVAEGGGGKVSGRE